MKKISEFEFEGIVQYVAGTMSEIQEVSIYGFKVDVTFESNSGKTHWNSFFDFDEETGDYTYNSPYPGSALPWQFGDRIQSELKK